MNDKSKTIVHKRANRVKTLLDKCLEQMNRIEDKVSMESAEFHLVSHAKHDLYNAKSNVEIIANRSRPTTI